MVSAGPPFTFEPAVSQDLEALVALRIEAMQESLERIGRFDPQRARARFADGFEPACTRHVVVGGQRVGFVVVKTAAEGLRLDHLYIRPARQGRGLGAAVLQTVCEEAAREGLPLRLSALRGSDANRFYQRHGFVPDGESEWDLHYLRLPPPVLRRANVADAAAFARFAVQVFHQTYGADTAPQDLQAYCATAFAASLLAAELTDPAIASWLAEAGGRVVGYVQVARGEPRPACVAPNDAAALLRLYVDPAWHGRGLAAQLMALARHSASAFGSRHLWLSVWERNPRAIAYYRKSGWVEVGQAEFVVGHDRQRDKVFLLDLDAP